MKSMPQHLDPVGGRYVQMDDVEWADFPEGLSQGGITWKLLNVSPEMGAWTAYYKCPKGSSFAPHVHIGPGEYYLTKGRMTVRGGAGEGGETAVAPGYGYEACNALHVETYFEEDSEFYMTFLGPLNFVDDEGNTVALVTWKDVQDAWEAATSG